LASPGGLAPLHFPQQNRGPERGADYTDRPSAHTMVLANFERQIHPIVVAHRGASATYPENTLPSFRGAVEGGADVIELDVRLTADNVLVILHDLDVSATTDGSGCVHTLTLAEVKRLNASGGREPRIEVPTLPEA